MFRPRKFFSLATAAATLVASLVAPGAAQASMEPTSVTAAPAVSSAHPRVLLNRADLQALTSALNTDTTAAALYAPLKERADSLLTAGVIRYSKETGDLQPVSRDFVNRVMTLGVAWRVTGDLKYADRLWRDIEAASKFPDWNPAHFLDTAEMSLGFAVSYDWLHGYLSTYKRSVMRTAIEEKAFKPALAAYSSKAHWTSTAGNWNIVVNASLGTAALSFDDLSPALSSEVLSRALGNIKVGLTAYGQDGSFNEGVTYWAYATNYLSIFASSLETSTGSRQGLLDGPGVAKSGEFILRMSGPSGHFANFGDAWSNEAVTAPLLALEALTKNATLRDRAIASLTGPDAVSISPQSLLWYSKARSVQGVRGDLTLDAAFATFPVATLRGAWGDRMATNVALKGGSGGQPGHEDLDAGSFTLDALGERWALDLGADSYKLPGYFALDSGERWDYYRKRAEGHNTVVVNPGYEPDSRVSGVAPVRIIKSEPGEAQAVTDLTSTHAGQAIESWRRGVSLFDGRSETLIQDEIKIRGTADLWWFMHTAADITLGADKRSAVLRIRDKAVEVRLLQPSGGHFVVSQAKPLWTSPHPDKQDPNAGIFKLAIHLEDTASTTIAVQVSPKMTATSSAAAAIKPLADWGLATGAQATLTELSVGGVPLADFHPSRFTYHQQASSVDAPPQVVAKAAAGADVTVTQAATTPGKAIVRVTEAGKVASTYTVSFHPGAVTVAKVTSSSGDARVVSDRKPYTHWTVTGTQTLTFDLGERRTVQHAEIDWRGRPNEFATFRIDVSDNATSWRQVFEGAVRSHTVNQWSSWTTGALKSRYVRLTVYGAGSDKLSSISELHLFSEANYTRSYPKTPRWQASAAATRVSLQVASSHQFEYTLTRPANAAEPARTYFTTDPSVASVSSTGRVTATGPGEANVGVRFDVAGESVYAVTHVIAKDPDTIERTARKDGYVQGGDAWNDYTFRNAQELYARHNSQYPAFDRVTYLGFDLTGIPAERVVSATLLAGMRPRSSETAKTHVAAYTVDGSWTEAGLTFNNRPRLRDRIGYTAVTGPMSPRSVDVTDAIRDAAGNADFTIGLSQDPGGVGEAVEVAVQSRRTLNPPRLVVQLADGLPAAPQVTKALSSSAEQAGSIDVNLTGPANSTATVDVWESSFQRCPVSRSSATSFGSKSVTFSASGTAAATLDGDLSAGSIVFATLRDPAGRVSRLSPCSEVERATGVGVVREFSPTQSGHVEGRSSADTVYNTATNLLVKRSSKYPEYDRYAYIEFDISSLQGAAIESAKLEVRALSPSAATQLTAFDVRQSWNQNTLSFNNRPAMGERVASAAVGTAASQVALDVTDLVRNRKGGKATIGLSQDDPGGDAIVTVSGHRSGSVPMLTVVLRPFASLDPPTVTSASGNAAGVPGRIEGVAAGPAGAALDITVFAADNCVSHRGAAREVGRVRVSTDAQGVASFGVDADVKVGESIVAAATAAGPRSSNLSSCSAVVHPSGVSEELVLPVGGDTFVHGGAWADTAFPTASELQVRATAAHPSFDRYALLSFDTGRLAGRTIESAILEVGARSSGGESHIAIHGITGTWDRSTVTFNTRPTFGGRLGVASVGTTAARRQIDVTSYMANTPATNGFAISQDGAGVGAGTVVLVDGSRTGRGATLTVRLAPQQ